MSAAADHSPAPPPLGTLPMVRIGPDDLSPLARTALQTGAVLARADVGVLAVSGPGAVQCMQGLLTNDIEKPGDEAFVYGALLTPKGMIVVDGWAARHGATVTYTVPGDARERTSALLTRSMPPRLARVRDQSAEVVVHRLAGPRALAIAQGAGLAVPGTPGRSTRLAQDATGWELARATEPAPFALQITTPASDAAALVERLVARGAVAAGATALECARILAGWPRIGAEVDEKTIPQEVRLDELGGVSYTKGCYTGQETVSRLHFRGHVNRQLRGLLFDVEPGAAAADVTYQDRDVGRVTSVMWNPEIGAGGRWIGLALLRREVVAGAVVRAARSDARVVDLPFGVASAPTAAPA